MGRCYWGSFFTLRKEWGNNMIAVAAEISAPRIDGPARNLDLCLRGLYLTLME